MQKQNSKNELHTEITLAIKRAKRQMFKRSREGMDLREAADRFVFDIAGQFANMVPGDPDKLKARAQAEFEANYLADQELQIRNPGPIDPEWVELSNAAAKIATSNAAPWGLKQPVIDFLSSESGNIWGGLMVRPPVIQRILVAASCKEDESEQEVSHDAS